MLVSKPSRLYSKFPGGSVGLALLVLRLVAGLGLVGEGIRIFTPAANSPEPTSVLLLGLLLVVSGALLVLGLQTFLASSTAAVCTAASALHGQLNLSLAPSDRYIWSFFFALFSVSGSLALLGPGGYSLDARLSGWRIIRLSCGPSNSNSLKEGEGAYVDR